MKPMSECLYDEPDDPWREVRDGRFEAPPYENRSSTGFSRAIALLLIGCFATPIVLPLFPAPQASPTVQPEAIDASQSSLPMICSAVAEQLQAVQRLREESREGTVRPERFEERCDAIGASLDQSVDQINQWQFPPEQQRQARELMLVVSLAGEARGQVIQAVNAESAERRRRADDYAERWARSAQEQLEQTRTLLP